MMRREMNFTSDNPPFTVQPDGVWHLYSAQYRHGFALFGIEFYARNDVEAGEMIREMRAGLSEPSRIIAAYGGAKARNN